MHRKWLLFDLAVTDYQTVLDLQERVVDAKISGEIQENVLLLLEHRPVFTLGYRGGLTNLKVSQSFLEKHHIAVVKTRRGGDITYHGPGQLIAYPIISLNKKSLSIPDYINLLEEVMLRTAADFNVSAARSDRNPGIWTSGKKIGSLGISVKRWVSCHGLALNVAPDLTPFSWINPCGLANVQVTSIALQRDSLPTMKEARKFMLVHFRSLFNIPSQESASRISWLTEIVKNLT